MLSVSDELKNIYKGDYLPNVPVNYPKKLTLYFPDIPLTIDSDEVGRFDIDSFSLDESLCSETDLTLGACESAQFKVKINGIVADLSGKKFIATQLVNNAYAMPLGTYWINSVSKQSDLGFKEITAYDAMKNTDVDVSVWYNGLTFPITVKAMRESLLTYLGISYENQTLTNDTISLEKTISPSSLVGRDVLKRLCELNAGFGHITRENKFKVIQLSGLGLYPSENLYPAEDLFPAESGEVITAGYQSIDYEEYIVEQITSLKIRQDDEDSGTTSGTGSNTYIITGNYLIYGKDSMTMQSIADEIFLQLKNKYYKPHSTKMIGLPYLEVGDSVLIVTSTDAIESFVFKRTLSGIQSLTDEISATGNQYRSESTSLSTEIQQLKGKTLVIKKDIEQLSINMTDMEEDLEAQITLTAGQLQTQITDNKNSLQSQITQTASSLQTQVTDNLNNANSQFVQQAASIALKVEKSGVIAAINISPETIKIEADNIQLEGLVTANSYFKILTDGSMEAVNGKFSGSLTSSSAAITGGSFKVTASGQNDTRIQLTYNTFDCSLSPYGMILNNSSSSNQYTTVRPGEIFLGNPTGTNNTTISYSGITTPTCEVNGSEVITGNTRNSYYYNSNRIEPITTSAGNVGLHGLNVASVNWCNDTFQPLSSSDIRLKKNFKSLDDLPIELFLEIETWQFEYILDTYPKGIMFGYKAQQIEEIFKKHGFDPFEYNLLELVNPRDYMGETDLIPDNMYRVNEKNFIAWNTLMIQKTLKSNLI